MPTNYFCFGCFVFFPSKEPQLQVQKTSCVLLASCYKLLPDWWRVEGLQKRQAETNKQIKLSLFLSSRLQRKECVHFWTLTPVWGWTGSSSGLTCNKPAEFQPLRYKSRFLFSRLQRIKYRPVRRFHPRFCWWRCLHLAPHPLPHLPQSTQKWAIYFPRKRRRKWQQKA